MNSNSFDLSQVSLEDLTKYLRDREIIDASTRAIEAQSLHESSNFFTSKRLFLSDEKSIIVKQYSSQNSSLAKEQAFEEARFHELAQDVVFLSDHMSQLLLHDDEVHLLIESDVGQGKGDSQDLFSENNKMPFGLVVDLMEFLIQLHCGVSDSTTDEVIHNHKLRQTIYAEHFLNRFTPENIRTQKTQDSVWHKQLSLFEKALFQDKLKNLGHRFLADGNLLVHGSFRPENITLHDESFYITNPSQSFFGFPEWDVGVLLAHLQLKGHDLKSIADAQDEYAKSLLLDPELTRTVMAFEMLNCFWEQKNDVSEDLFLKTINNF